MTVYGGRYVPETLISALDELSRAYQKFKKDRSSQAHIADLLKHYVGRPTPLYEAKRLSKALSCRVFLKREDLNHTGAHKINNCIGQMVLAANMGKKRIIAETGAGQHGVATATAAALMGMPCVVYMGQKDMDRQALNVFRMKLLGAEVRAVKAGTATLKEATTEAIRDWLATVDETHYIIGSVVGPDPYPTIVRDLQSVIGREAKRQYRRQTGKVAPDQLVACVGGGSNAMGIFYPFIKTKAKLVAVEAAGEGLDTDRHAAPLNRGKPGILHGSLSYLMQTQDGQICEAHSISAGLDYPGVGPELSQLKDDKRLDVTAVTDQQALAACTWVSRLEGIIPALETAHAFAYLKKMGRRLKGQDILVNVSGRGDKDMGTLMERLSHEL